jgi:hypothetical protein
MERICSGGGVIAIVDRPLHIIVSRVFPLGAMHGGLSLLTILTLVLLGFSFCGVWMPLGDTLAVGRLHLAALLVLATPFLFKRRARRLALIALVSAVLASGQIMAGFSAADAVAGERHRATTE